MTFNYTYAAAPHMEDIKEEISRIADMAYADDGTPLYDTIMAYTRDQATLDRLCNDGFRDIIARFADVVSVLSPAPASYDVTIYSTGTSLPQIAIAISEAGGLEYGDVATALETLPHVFRLNLDRASAATLATDLASIKAADAFVRYDMSGTGAMLPPEIVFILPDLPEGYFSGTGVQALDRFIAMNAVAVWAKQKRPALFDEYAARAKSALDQAETIIRTRVSPL